MNKLHSNSIYLFFFSSVLGWLLFGVMFSLIIFPIFYGPATSLGLIPALNYPLIVIFIFSAIVVLSFVWAKLVYSSYKYELTERGFKKERGVIYKSQVVIPYGRIQNVDIYRGILHRILGLSDLHIQTAGSSYSIKRGEGRLPGLLPEDAERLRDTLIDRVERKESGV